MNQIIVGYCDQAEVFVCLRPPAFVAELGPHFALPAATPSAGAKRKVGQMRCQVVQWLQDPLESLDLDGLAKHVRLAFEDALDLRGDGDDETTH